MPLRNCSLTLLAVLTSLVLLCAGRSAIAATSEATLYNFSTATAYPYSALVSDAAGRMYGVSLSGTYAAGSIYELVPSAHGAGWKAKTLFSFNGTDEGSLPTGNITIDDKGNLYGTTAKGGTGNCSSGGANLGCGVVYELSKSGGNWNETVLYNFQGGKDGDFPYFSPLLLGANGYLYGTTLYGGLGCNKHGCGVLFALAPPAHRGDAWKETVLHRFTESQGSSPMGSLLQLGNTLFGATSFGGAYGNGTIYESTLDGKVNVLYSFKGSPDGSNNGFATGVTADSSGNLYGFTIAGGTDNAGTVFQLTPAAGSWTETVLYSFTGNADGADPQGPPVLDGSSNLYGITQAGGDLSGCSLLTGNGCGVVFELANSGSTRTESVLHTFTDGVTSQTDDGALPFGPLTFGFNGNLYSVTEEGGTGGCYLEKGIEVGCGTAFSITP